MKCHFLKSYSIRIILSLAVLLTGSGCAHFNVDFSLNNSGFKPKGNSIAIISGTKETQNVALAKLVADSLRKNSRYQVATQAQVSQLMQPYPQTIKGPYKSAYFYIDTDWDLGDKKKIADVQRALGVDYLYVIWAPIGVSRNGSAVFSVPAVAQLFEQPNAREVAKTSMGLFAGDEGNVFFREGADEIARQLAEETKMALAAKK
jgi:hypothetical protein